MWICVFVSFSLICVSLVFWGGWRVSRRTGHDSPETHAHRGGRAEAQGLERCSPKALLDRSEGFLKLALFI